MPIADHPQQFFIRSTPSACELWHTRKQTAQHLAAFIFQSYLFSVGRRLPTNILFTRASGQMHSADLIPALSSNKPEFSNHEAVPFRLTPNLQAFVGPIGVEGVLVSALMSIARCMTESEASLPLKLKYAPGLTKDFICSTILSTDSAYSSRKKCSSGILLARCPNHPRLNYAI